MVYLNQHESLRTVHMCASLCTTVVYIKAQMLSVGGEGRWVVQLWCSALACNASRGNEFLEL